MLEDVDIQLRLRSKKDIKTQAKKHGLPANTAAFAYFSKRFNIIVISDPPEPPPISRGWEWAMYQRDMWVWARLMAHEIRHVREGHFHD